jgi:hypothetical protein
MADKRTPLKKKSKEKNKKNIAANETTKETNAEPMQ